MHKYAPDIECTDIQRVEGDGSRPAALLSFSGKKYDSLSKLSLRLDGMYWHGRARLLDDARLSAGQGAPRGSRRRVRGRRGP